MKLILPIALGLILVACNEQVSETVNEEPVVVEEAQHDDGEEAIVMNNGKKWTVVPTMMVYIRNMEQGLEEFSTNDAPTREDYQKLAVLIDENIRTLTSNCTMGGQAHDELHKWLVPFIELSEDFDAATEIEEQEAIYHSFQKAYETFNTYFE